MDTADEQVEISSSIGEATRGAPTRRLLILYGTETGNSMEVAGNIAREAEVRDFRMELKDMAEYDPAELEQAEDILIVVSTAGEGDPPQPVASFFEYIEGDDAARLDHVRFAVLALGDSSYEFFCEAGKRLDRRFEDLGGERMAPRVDCDIDYDEPAADWCQEMLAWLSPQSATVKAVEERAVAETAMLPGHDKRKPVSARVVKNSSLVKYGSSKDTRHIELAFDDPEVKYAPGDALGMYASNSQAVIKALLDQVGFSPDTAISLNGKDVALAEAFSTRLEIATATPRFLEYWANLTRAETLLQLLKESNSRLRSKFLHANHIVDIVRDYPAKNVEFEGFIGSLRPLQPRLYSIASSQLATGGDVHLTVAPVEYVLHGITRRGVASGQLRHRSDPGASIPVYIHPNPHFHLPEDDVPIIMIGAGTGVAPYRGFLQERQLRNATGKNYLFFGERNSVTDFLYREEWAAFHKDGVLTDMETAFSRDYSQKVYVQHRLIERAADVFSLLEEGAHLYVCGDATYMAPDVHEALIHIVSIQKGAGREAAEAYVRELQSDRRYHRDVY